MQGRHPAVFKPDVVVLIDYGGFNMRIAKFAKENGLKVFFYISPKVWAWNTKRAWKLKASVDRMFCILPFEKDFYKKFDWDVDYVGNPVLDAIKKFKPDPEFLAKHGLRKDQKIVALLPGSRRMELKRVVPILADVAKTNVNLQFVVAAVKTLPIEMYGALNGIPNVKARLRIHLRLTIRRRRSHGHIRYCNAGDGFIPGSGNVVVQNNHVGRSNRSLLGQIEWLGLVNLILNKDVVKGSFTRQTRLVPKLNEGLNRLLLMTIAGRTC